MNFEEAYESCEQEHGNLAFLENDLDYQAIQQILPINKDVWLGAKTVHFAENEKFVWLHNIEEISSTSSYNFTLFHREDEYDCVTFEKLPNSDIWLNERVCTDRFQFLCQETCINDPGKFFEFRFVQLKIILSIFN